MPPPVQSLGRACPPSIFFHRPHRFPAHAPARVNHAPPSPSPPHASRCRLPRHPFLPRDAASPRRPPPQLTALATRRLPWLPSPSPSPTESRLPPMAVDLRLPPDAGVWHPPAPPWSRHPAVGRFLPLAFLFGAPPPPVRFPPAP